VNTYTYDQANRLASVSSTEYEIEYGYNGLGDRLSQTVDSETTTYTLDIVGGLTQVLADETRTYLYGMGRMAQFTGENEKYFLGDALGSVRQLVDESGNITLARGYEPFGEVLEAGGEASSSYGFTGEWTDITGLVNLRARYYAPYLNQFIQRDPIVSDPYRSLGWNRYAYSWDNPIYFTDPSGNVPQGYYDRVAAASYAVRHDRNDPIEAGYYNWTKVGTDCTSFVSLSMWAGGLRDPRGDPEALGIPDYSTAYWDKEKTSGNPYSDHPTLTFESWIVTWENLSFLANVLGFRAYTFVAPPHFNHDTGANVDTEAWLDFLRRTPIQPGDVVFYQNIGYSYINHAAMIIGWGSQTFSTHTMADPGIPTGCGDMHPKPRVVDRSGWITYNGSRSIDNTDEPLLRIIIMHIESR
jgi:RHS repeat-associated protein